ncbi:RNA polymerase sigma factor SigM [Clostridium acetireducens DSM 10703]|jgi:RNA polymerase sigma-70 factor (TIGR02952 family)|uniref:RNA polymerase sigma factor SigM n=1 Tax=Clostridium acetireducens DSM 10703 TaxID=1121290 RepID=A0A1E8EZR2_9CLOT|nr:ECF subfamily RNA polymerase sigma factor, BldN family [Clostridium acetireducens]OFI06605.1 RNA polymerase sigma factor SigM [Clostridium acetireducens DSM 10703]
MEQFALINPLDKKETKEKDFTYIFKTYYKRVYNYIYYRINCTYTTEDLTSQVFEKVMIKINTYSRDKSPFEVWLFAIARNVINDYIRKSKKHKFFSIDSFKNLISKEKNPEDVVMLSETNNKLSKALNILNERERNIVSLKFGATLKNKEIAKILDITESNVGVILYRTMKKLKIEMERED